MLEISPNQYYKAYGSLFEVPKDKDLIEKITVANRKVLENQVSYAFEQATNILKEGSNSIVIKRRFPSGTFKFAKKVMIWKQMMHSMLKLIQTTFSYRKKGVCLRLHLVRVFKMLDESLTSDQDLIDRKDDLLIMLLMLTYISLYTFFPELDVLSVFT